MFQKCIKLKSAWLQVQFHWLKWLWINKQQISAFWGLHTEPPDRDKLTNCRQRFCEWAPKGASSRSLSHRGCLNLLLQWTGSDSSAQWCPCSAGKQCYLLSQEVTQSHGAGGLLSSDLQAPKSVHVNFESPFPQLGGGLYFREFKHIITLFSWI